jgi:hypothetical protein
VQIAPAAKHVSIVMLGHFNPAILQPSWLALHKLIGEAEANSASVGAIFAEIAQYEIPERFSLGVSLEKFAATSRSPQPETIKDLVISVFGSLLPHTPVSAVGINLSVHFDTGSPSRRDKVGLALAPLNPWGQWQQYLRPAGVPADGSQSIGGMQSLTMRQTQRHDGKRGHILAKIEPSTVVPLTGIYMEINDHYTIAVPTTQGGARPTNGAAASQLVEERWEASMKFSEHIVDQIMALAKGLPQS